MKIIWTSNIIAKSYNSAKNHITAHYKYQKYLQNNLKIFKHHEWTTDNTMHSSFTTLFTDNSSDPDNFIAPEPTRDRSGGHTSNASYYICVTISAITQHFVAQYDTWMRDATQECHRVNCSTKKGQNRRKSELNILHDENSL